MRIPRRPILAAVLPALSLSACVASSSMTPLAYAGYEGNGEAVDSLLGQGADPGALGPNHRDAVEMALLHGHPELARAMVRRCVEAEKSGRRCTRTLQDAAMVGDEGAAQAFLAGGGDVDGAIEDLRKRAAEYDAIRDPSGFLAGAFAQELRPMVDGYGRGLVLLQRLKAPPPAAVPVAAPSSAVSPAPAQPQSWWR